MVATVHLTVFWQKKLYVEVISSVTSDVLHKQYGCSSVAATEVVYKKNVPVRKPSFAAETHEKPPEISILNIPSHRQNLVHLRFEAIFQ